MDGSTRRLRTDSREAAFVGGAEALIFGVLLFVVGSLILVNGWAVIDARFAAANAARAATRAAISTPIGSDPHVQARVAADRVLRQDGHKDVEYDVVAERSTSLGRCDPVRYRVTIRVHPTALGRFGWSDGIDVMATSGQVVDPYRSGLPAGRQCPW
ncbi:MAG: hypothetical protein WD011_04990 [Nitriliruptoraceae bacterium]